MNIKTIPGLPLKNKVMSGTPNPLNQAEKTWINQNHKNFTVVQMCAMLQRTPRFVYEYLGEKGLEPLANNNTNKYRRITEKPRQGYFNEKEYIKSLSNI